MHVIVFAMMLILNAHAVKIKRLDVMIMSLIERKYERNWFNTIINAMSFAIDCMEETDAEKYRYVVNSFLRCREEIIRYSIVRDDDVIVRCPDRYYECFLEAKSYIKYVTDNEDYNTDWAQKADEETKLWRQQMHQRKIDEYKFYYDGWIKYQEDHKDKKKITKSAYARSIGQEPAKVRAFITAYERSMNE